MTQKNDWGWVDDKEKEIEENKSKDYFNIAEGSQQFFLLSHFAPLTQVWDNATKKYRSAVEGDKNPSIKGVCWVLQDGLVKQAKMPYTIVKSVKALAEDSEWEFTIPFPHQLTLTAKNAGSKEVEYTLTPSPRKTEFTHEILDELSKKPTPENIVEKIKGKSDVQATSSDNGGQVEYPKDDIDPENIPF